MIRYEVIAEESETGIPFEYILLPKYRLKKETIINCAVSVEDAYDSLIQLGKRLNEISKINQFEFQHILPIDRGLAVSFDLYNQINTSYEQFNIQYSPSTISDLKPLSRDENSLTNDKIEVKTHIHRNTINDQHIIQLLNEWIEENGYPTQNHPTPNFINNCIYLYLFNDCIKWMYKANKDEFDIDYEAKLRFYVNFFKNIELFNIEIDPDKNHSLYFLIMNEYGFDISLSSREIEIFYNCDFKNNLNDIIEILRKLLLVAIHQITKSGMEFPSNYSISKNKPFYNTETDTYAIVDVANSLIGIAYYRLNQNATSYYLGKRKRICANPHCNNIFEVPKGNHKYCSICRKKDIPNILRVKRFTEKQSDRT